MYHQPSISRPLAGIRVFELGIAIAGPTITRYLAHFGAEVIKIESQINPDNVRSYGSHWLSPEEYGREVWWDTAPPWGDFNAGKRSVVLDLKAPEGAAAAKRLLAKSDIFVSNFRPRAVANLGFDHDSARTLRPDIIYIQPTGYGNTAGPYADYAAWGRNLAALTGVNDLTGWPDRPPLEISMVAYPDQTNGLYGLLAVLSALDYRERTGEGQAIDLSQFEATVALLGPWLLDYELNGRCATRHGNRSPWAAPQGIYSCRGNDRWVAISAFTEEEWQALCQVAEHPDWAEDPRFLGVRDRLAHHDELDALIAGWTGQHTADEVAGWLQRAGIAAMPVLDHAGLALDPHLAARDFWVLADSHRFGKDFAQGVPLHLSHTPGLDERWGPAWGEDTDYVLGELCGYEAAEIEALIQKGVAQRLPAPEVKFERPYLRWLRHFLPNLDWPE